MWQILAAEAASHPNLDSQTLHGMTVNLHTAEDLATAAVSATGIMVKSAAAVLSCFEDMPDGERAILS
jgi:hypothetical protein